MEGTDRDVIVDCSYTCWAEEASCATDDALDMGWDSW